MALHAPLARRPGIRAVPVPRRAPVGPVATRLNARPAIVAQRKLAEQLTRARPAQRVVQRAVEDDLVGLEQAYQTTDDPLLKKLLTEVRTLSDIEFTDQPDSEQGHASRENIGDRRSHEVNLDPGITGALNRQSLVLHEMIHVSADRKYNANSIGEPDPGLTGVIDHSQPNPHRQLGAQFLYRGKLADDLRSDVAHDHDLTEEQREIVHDRLGRVTGASHRELDSVSTELYFRLTQMGVNKASITYRTIAAMAEGTYRSRNEGVRLEDVYAPPSRGKVGGKPEDKGCVIC